MTDKGETTILDGEFEEAAPDPAPRPRRRLLRWLPWGLVLLLASFIGGLFAAPAVEDRLIAWDLLPPLPAPSATEASFDDDDVLESLDMLRARLETAESALADIGDENSALAQELTRLGDNIAQGGVAAPAMPEEFTDRLSSLQARLNELGQTLSGLEAERAGQVAPEELENLTRAVDSASRDRARIESAIAALQRRLATLEAVNRTGSVASTLYRDMIALHRRVEAGQPYVSALQAVRLQVDALPDVLRAGAASALATLGDHATGGVPTRQALAASFPDIARRLQQAGGGSQDDGWLGRFRRSLSSIVTVRPDGRAEGEDLSAILARAEAAVAAGQLDIARKEMESVSGDTLDAVPGARVWTDDVRARLAVEEAIESLFSSLTPASDGETGEGP